MPRGNDAKAAAEELRERYEAGYGNAEDILRAQRAATPPELQAANLRQVDAEATAALDLEDVAKKANVPQVLDAAVRGDDVVYVAYDPETDRTHKGVLVDGKPASTSDPHAERLQSLAKEAEKAAKRREKDGDEAEESKPSGAEAKAQKQREKARKDAAAQGSLRAKTRLPEGERAKIEEAERERGSDES